MPLVAPRERGAEPVADHEIAVGPVSARLERSGAALRDIRVNGELAVSGLSFVARDADWGTLPLDGNPRVVTTQDGVVIRSGGDAHHPHGTLSWEVEFRVTVLDVEATVTVTTQSGFLTNRTGLVVLHAYASCRGQEATITHPDQSRTQGRFPRAVSPHQPFLDIAGLAYQTAGGSHLHLAFEGEIFETEDQRNWTDASYKTYSRPLSAPFPYRINPGETVQQRIRIDFTAGPAARTGSPRAAVSEVSPLPRLGVGQPAWRPVATGAVSRALEGLGLGYVALEIDPERDGWAASVRAHTANLATPLRLDCRKTAPPGAILAGLREALDGVEPAMLTLWDADDEAIADARRIFPQSRVGSGTGAFFAEFNRGMLPIGADYLTWSSNPTVHAQDDDTIGESIEPLIDIVATAKEKAPSQELSVGPLTLAMRFNPNATSPEGRRSEPPADSRQYSVLAASWLLGTVSGLLDPMVTDVTAFEVAGQRGVIRSDGTLTPAGHLVARLAPLAGRAACRIEWEGDPRARGLMIETPNGRVLAIAYMRAEEVRLPLPNGVWRRAEELTAQGFVARPSTLSDTIEIDGFGTVWLTEAVESVQK